MKSLNSSLINNILRIAVASLAIPFVMHFFGTKEPSLMFTYAILIWIQLSMFFADEALEQLLTKGVTRRHLFVFHILPLFSIWFFAIIWITVFFSHWPEYPLVILMTALCCLLHSALLVREVFDVGSWVLFICFGAAAFMGILILGEIPPTFQSAIAISSCLAIAALFLLVVAYRRFLTMEVP